MPVAIQKAIEDAKKNLFAVPRHHTTITHEITGVYGAGRVLLKPASQGTAVIAGAGVRAVLELADEMALTNMEGYMADDLTSRLQAHYTDGAIFEIGQTMAILCGFAKFLRVYGIAGA